MKSKTQKNIVSVDTSTLTDDQLELLASLVNEKDKFGVISEKEGCKIIGNILKRLRKNLGFTQVEMAKRAGYDNAQFLSNVERGASKIPMDKAKAFVKAYDADEKMHPAIYKLTHQDVWPEFLIMVEMAGADSPAFDYEVETWISENR